MKTTDKQPPIKVWQIRNGHVPFGKTPAIMGIVNVTPDSFSDGGNHTDPTRAVTRAMQLVEDGADLLDVGGESTRPYSLPVSEAEELTRVIPVIEQLSAVTDVPISIDTSKAQVAREAVNAGAQIINDVTGLTGDPKMMEIALHSGAGICAMHMQGTPQTMQDDPSYEDVVEEVFDYLSERRQHFIRAGIAADKICLDPGIGFGKTHEHNLQLLGRVSRLLDLQSPILIGHSRKGFIGKMTGDKTAQRVAGTLAVSLHLAEAGIHIVRVHDVLQTRQAFSMFAAIETRKIDA